MSDLHRAARDNNIRLLDRILATPGINVDATDRHGRTPLHCAAQHGSDKTLEALLRAGASSHAKSFDGKTPLSLAMEHRHSAVSLKRKDGLLICNLTQCPLHVHTHTHTTSHAHNRSCNGSCKRKHKPLRPTPPPAATGACRALLPRA